MANYNIYPAVDSQYNFPPPVRDSIAKSSEVVARVDQRIAAGVDDAIAASGSMQTAAETAVQSEIEGLDVVQFVDPAIPTAGYYSKAEDYALIESDKNGRMTRGIKKADGTQVIPRAEIHSLVSGPPGWDIVIAAGQSNSGSADTPISGVYPVDPLLIDRNGGVLTTDLQAIGPEFAREYKKSRYYVEGRKVAVARIGSGGTGFTTSSISPVPEGYKAGAGTWDRNLTADPQNYVVKLLSEARDMLALGGPGSRIVAIVWSQGEVETNGAPILTKTEYAAHLDDLIDYIRTELSVPDLPWVIGSTVPEWYEMQADRTAIAEALAETPYRNSYTGYTWGFPGTRRNDQEIHWSSLGQMYRAQKMATVGFEEALLNRPGTKPNSPQNLRSTRTPSTIKLEWDRPLGRSTSLAVKYSINSGTDWLDVDLDIAHGSRASIPVDNSTEAIVRAWTTNGTGDSPYVEIEV